MRIFLEDEIAISPESYTTGNHLVENVLVEGATHTGMDITGGHNTLRSNRVTDTGNLKWGTYAYGIKLDGPYARVLDNDISNTATGGPSETAGLLLRYASFSVIEGNRLTNISLASGTDPNPDFWPTYGIWIFLSDDVLVVDNRITTSAKGIGWSGPSTGKYRDNLTFNVYDPFIGRTDAGGNN